jgi:hypothetical protein
VNRCSSWLVSGRSQSGCKPEKSLSKRADAACAKDQIQKGC